MTIKIILHDTENGSFPNVQTVRERFQCSAADAGIDGNLAASVFADALAGDAAARELVEATCGVEFL